MGINNIEKTKEKNNFNFAVHPGMILNKYLKNIKMTQLELSRQTGINKTVINEIIKGKRNITTSIAIKFEKVFDMPVKFWCGLQSDYDEAILRLKNNKQLKLYINSDTKVKQETFKKIELETKQEIYSCAI